MIKLRQYTATYRIPVNNPINRGDSFSKEVFDSLGDYQDRVEIKEFEIPDDKLEEALISEPYLYQVPSLVESAKEIIKPTKLKKVSKD